MPKQRRNAGAYLSIYSGKRVQLLGNGWFLLWFAAEDTFVACICMNKRKNNNRAHIIETTRREKKRNIEEKEEMATAYNTHSACNCCDAKK